MKKILGSVLGNDYLRPIVSSMRTTWTKCNEFALNIDTFPSRSLAEIVKATRDNLQDDDVDRISDTWHKSPDYWYLYKIVKMIKPDVKDKAVFYDLGSGQGRLLSIMARYSFKKVVGVEQIEELCQSAKENCSRVRGKQAPVEIRCQDAAQTDLSDGTIYFMFNPFGEDKTRDVLKNIHRSLRHNPREIKIIYYNAVHENLLQSSNWLEADITFRTATGKVVSIWKNHFRTTFRGYKMLGFDHKQFISSLQVKESQSSLSC